MQVFCGFMIREQHIESIYVACLVNPGSESSLSGRGYVSIILGLL